MQIVTSATPSGILTRTRDSEGRVVAALTFAVGRQDEPLELRGINSVVSQLIDQALNPRTLVTLRRRTPTDISFVAVGAESQVLGHLHRVADAVRELSRVTSSELDRAKRTVFADLGYGPELHPGAQTIRFGLQGIGLEDLHSLALRDISPQTVARWAEVWFTAANAAVSINRSLDPGFDLDLPGGVKPPHSKAVPSQLARPTLAEYGRRPVSLSVLAPAGVPFAVRAAIEEEFSARLDDIDRVAQNTSADSIWSTNGDRAVLEWKIGWVHEASIIIGAINTLRDIAQGTIASESVLLANERALWAMGETALRWTEPLMDLSGSSLRDLLPTPRDETFFGPTTSEEVTAVLREALPTLLVALDPRQLVDGEYLKLRAAAETLGLDFVDRRALGPSTEEVWREATTKSKVFRAGRRSDKPRQQAVLSSRRLLVKTGSEVSAVDLNDLAVVGSELPDGLTLVDQVARTETLPAWKWGTQLLDEVKRAAPPSIVENWNGPATRGA